MIEDPVSDRLANRVRDLGRARYDRLALVGELPGCARRVDCGGIRFRTVKAVGRLRLHTDNANAGRSEAVLIELSPADVIVEVGSRGRVPKESGVHEHSPGAVNHHATDQALRIL